MIIFRVRTIIMILDCLKAMETMCAVKQFTDSNLKFLQSELLPSTRGYLEDLGMTHSIKQLKRFECLSMEDGIEEIRRGIKVLGERIRDEIEDGFFLHLTDEDAKFYHPDEMPFGGDVDINFPSCFYDIREAGCCLGLQRSTAAVFHVVRCMEAGIRALSRCLAIPDPTKGIDRNWGAMLNKLRDAINAKWPASKDRLEGDGRLFGEMYATLAAVQNPYRNATAHLDKTYTQDDAKDIFVMVGAFMKKIAARMDERGQPLA